VRGLGIVRGLEWGAGGGKTLDFAQFRCFFAGVRARS